MERISTRVETVTQPKSKKPKTSSIGGPVGSFVVTVIFIAITFGLTLICNKVSKNWFPLPIFLFLNLYSFSSYFEHRCHNWQYFSHWWINHVKFDTTCLNVLVILGFLWSKYLWTFKDFLLNFAGFLPVEKCAHRSHGSPKIVWLLWQKCSPCCYWLDCIPNNVGICTYRKSLRRSPTEKRKANSLQV